MPSEGFNIFNPLTWGPELGKNAAVNLQGLTDFLSAPIKSFVGALPRGPTPAEAGRGLLSGLGYQNLANLAQPGGRPVTPLSGNVTPGRVPGAVGPGAPLPATEAPTAAPTEQAPGGDYVSQKLAAQGAPTGPAVRPAIPDWAASIFGGGSEALGGVLDLVTGGINNLINQGVRTGVADMLGGYLGPGGTLSEEVRGISNQGIDALKAIPGAHYQDATATLAGQRQAFADQGGTTGQMQQMLAQTFGYGEGATAQDPSSRDPRSAMGRFNLNMDQMNDALSSSTGSKTEALGAISNDIGRFLIGISGEERAAYNQAKSNLDASVGQSFGMDSPEYQSQLNKLNQQRMRNIGNSQRQLQGQYTKMKVDTINEAATRDAQLRTAFNDFSTRIGGQQVAEQGMVTNALGQAILFDENVRQNFNNVERGIVDQFHTEQAAVAMDIYNIGMTAANFETQGLHDIANAMYGLQLDPGTFQGWQNVGGSINNAMVNWMNARNTGNQEYDPTAQYAQAGATGLIGLGMLGSGGPGAPGAPGASIMGAGGPH